MTSRSRLSAYSISHSDARGNTAHTPFPILDGVVLAGWRTGAEVHVEFMLKPSGQPRQHSKLTHASRGRLIGDTH
jgi:hypothetical protein